MNPKLNRHLVRCESHCPDACFKPYKFSFRLNIFTDISPQPTVRQTHVNVLLQVRMHKSLLNIEMAQVKIQFARHCCQKPNTLHSNSGRKLFSKSNVHSLLIPPRYKPRLDFRGPVVLISFPRTETSHCIDVAFHWSLRSKFPRIQQPVKLAPRRILPKMSVLRSHSLLVAPWHLAP